MPINYQIIVQGAFEEPFVAYNCEDLDEATGQADFCRAMMPGAKVSIEKVTWEEEF